MVCPFENVPVIWFWPSTATDCKLAGGEAVLLQLADLRRAARIGELGEAVGAEIELDVAEVVAVHGQVLQRHARERRSQFAARIEGEYVVPTFCQAACVPVAFELL